MHALISDIPVLRVNTFVILGVVLSSTLHLVIVAAIIINVLVCVIGIDVHILQHTISTTNVLLLLTESILPTVKNIISAFTL